MKDIELAVRSAISTRPTGQSVKQSLQESIDALSNQIDLLESWDSVYGLSVWRFFDMDVAQFIDYDGHISCVGVPDYYDMGVRNR